MNDSLGVCGPGGIKEGCQHPLSEHREYQPDNRDVTIRRCNHTIEIDGEIVARCDCWLEKWPKSHEYMPVAIRLG